jgi:hypothetical protein
MNREQAIDRAVEALEAIAFELKRSNDLGEAGQAQAREGIAQMFEMGKALGARPIVVEVPPPNPQPAHTFPRAPGEDA